MSGNPRRNNDGDPPPLQDCNNNNNNKLPPPPRVSGGVPLQATPSTTTRTSTISNSPTNTRRRAAPPTPPPHASTAPIQVLESAPPSLNLESTTTAAATAAVATATPVVVATTLPPPPPPPPPPRGSSTSSSSSVSVSGMSSAAAAVPPLPYSGRGSTTGVVAAGAAAGTIVDLPPPPVLKATSTTTTAATTTRGVVPPPLPIGVHDTAATTATTRTTTTTKPNKLPHTTFASKTLQILAKRQTHIPILLIATEAAHKAAWKNQLRLDDLLEGLMQSVLSSRSSSSSSSSSSSRHRTATSSSSSQQQQPLAPFRSVSRTLYLTWDDIHVTFYQGDSDDDNADDGGGCAETAYATATTTSPDDSRLHDLQAAQLLQQEAALQEQDGNLEQELFLLEDQIDNMLQSNHYADDDDGNTTVTTGFSRGRGSTDSSRSSRSKHRQTSYYTAWEERQRHDEQVHKDAFSLTSPLNIPWLWRYRLALDATTDHGRHELFHCPAICLLVCTTQEVTNPMETLRSLASTHNLPGNYRNGLFDPAAVRYEALVLHDNTTGPMNWDEAALVHQLRQVFGPGASVLRINSVPAEQAVLLAQEETTDIWHGKGQKGNCLSMNDRVAIRQYLQNLVTTCLLPALERRVADLNTIVNDRKKGVKNALKSLWRTGKIKDDEDSSGKTSKSLSKKDEVLYRYDSIENQTRLLADTLFLLKDYDAALGMYRLIKDDFKQDKAHAEYGSVQEMMALCMYMNDSYGRAREIYSHVENALLSYSRAADDERGPNQWGEKPGRITAATRSTRLATRLCLVLISTHNVCTDRHLEVADLLASASSNENALGAATLLEQASAHYFHAEMYRKYAFHMLMSGHMFRSAEQDHHAFRCFASALYIYREGRWEELHNHLRSALASQLYSMGRMAIALQLYAKLVGSTEGGRVSVKSQQKFVNHLLEICNEHPKAALAAADRLAAPAKLSGAERDAVRKDKLDRIVQVVRYTKSATRVLELPNVDLPLIDDSTVTVLAEEASHHRQESVPGFGDAGTGVEEVWEELMLATIAEQRAAAEAKAQVDDEVIYNALKKIKDPEIRKVIAEMDKERANQNLRERAKRSASYKEKPPVRAQMEPYFIEFAMTNPLHIPIDLADLQLVVKMSDEKSGRECTNEDAVKITPLESFDKKDSWKFHSSDAEFAIADFCRVSADGDRGLRRKWKSAEEVTPFFVVTKTNITLEPESRKSVSVGICPLEQGRLEILGVRYRLFDDVWLYHPFYIKGELLQNSRQNRANRVRGEPMLLKATVERGMPCLTAELINPDPVDAQSEAPPLQGQIRPWTLRVANIGTAVAGRLVLKTNLPWVSAQSDDGDAGSTHLSTSNCIGPSGTLLNLPFRGRALKKNGQLQPGESIDFSVCIRTAEAGKQGFYMLFRYELAQDDDRSEAPRFRWLRKMFEVPVYPSLTLSASLTPSYLTQGEHVLSAELTNYRTDRPDKMELILEKMCLASWRYRLHQVEGQLESEEDARLGWQERITLHYKVTRQEAGESKLITECRTVVNGSRATTLENQSNLLTFLCLERAHEQFMATLAEHKIALVRAAAAHDAESQHPRSISSIRRANTNSSHALDGEEIELSGADDNVHPTSIDRLCPRTKGDAETVHLTCSWRSQDGSIRGQHYIRGLFVRPTEKTRGCPITVTAQHPVNIANDFRKGPAKIPFSITLRNRLVQTPISFEFALERPETFDFAGPENFSTELCGGQELSVPLQALIPTAGVYNLQRVRLTVHRGNLVSYLFPLQWLVSVSDV